MLLAKSKGELVKMLADSRAEGLRLAAEKERLESSLAANLAKLNAATATREEIEAQSKKLASQVRDELMSLGISLETA